LHTETLSGEGYHPLPGRGTAGLDVGTSLVKLALPRPPHAFELRLYPRAALDEACRFLRSEGVARLGATGGGGRAIARGFDGVVVDEFEAWRRGAAALLSGLQGGAAPRYLLVSIGTGTSMLLVDGLQVKRVGGTALGGGTLMGLCTQLAGTESFEEVVALAARGDRNAVDLLVSDVYPDGDGALLGAVTAAHFGKLALGGAGREPPDPADLVQAVLAMVGQNVGLLSMAIAAAADVGRVVYGGSTLRHNPLLAGTLEIVTRALGREPVLLTHGEFAGALGALHLANP
jgi:type II pantothenate kinase